MHAYEKPRSALELLQLAVDLGLIVGGKAVVGTKQREYEKFTGAVMSVGKIEEQDLKERFEEQNEEYRLGVASGTLDVGQDDYILADAPVEEITARLNAVFPSEPSVGTGNCFQLLCKQMGVEVGVDCKSVMHLTHEDRKALASNVRTLVGYTVYSEFDSRNHVVAVAKGTKTGVVQIVPVDAASGETCIHGVTSAQEFFNQGGRMFRTKFFANNEDDSQETAGSGYSNSGMGGTEFSPAQGTVRGASGGFGGNAMPGPSRIRNYPDPPESIAGDDVMSGSANTTGGVVRPKKRQIAAKGSHSKDVAALKSYDTTGYTMFNNADELYLDTISREYAQEIIEDLFDVWGVPKEQSNSVTYAEDLLWLFLIARTASNKADYNVVYDVPTKSGTVEADFSKFSNLLASKYGVTRRNFSRGVADDLKAYLNRVENQFIKTKSAARINADPQYGHLSFDGSTGCSGMTTSEQKFTRLLEARNLYERADMLAEGASDALMQGIHGGARSVVAR